MSTSIPHKCFINAQIHPPIRGSSESTCAILSGSCEEIAQKLLQEDIKNLFSNSILCGSFEILHEDKGWGFFPSEVQKLYLNSGNQPSTQKAMSSFLKCVDAVVVKGEFSEEQVDACRQKHLPNSCKPTSNYK